MTDFSIIALTDFEHAQKTGELAREIWTEYFTPILGSGQVEYMLEHFQSADAIYSSMNEGMRYFWLCEGDEPVGYFAVKTEPDAGRMLLSKIYIKSGSRGNGYARRAFTFIRAMAAREALHTLRLTVNKKNIAVEAYKKMGMEITGNVVTDIGGGYVMDDYIMEMQVPSDDGRNAAVIVAAGRFTRMEGVNKQLAEIGGEPVLVRTVRAFQEASCIDEIVVVARREDVEAIQKLLCTRFGFDKVKLVVAGGDTRQTSVENGLKATRCGYVAVHDGARPLVPVSVIEKTVTAARECGGAAAAVRVKDTVKLADSGRFIKKTPDRSLLWNVQTPQVFSRNALSEAIEEANKHGWDFTDDCQLMEMCGQKVYLQESVYGNIKITTPDDLILAEMILRAQQEGVQ